MCEGVKYLHGVGICHRDLKLENILIDDRNNVKIIDFGFSVCTAEKLRMFCGTPSYMAPEIIQKKEYQGQKTDIWALGIILFVMLTGNFPFKGQTEKELFGKIKRGMFHMPETLPFEAKCIITRMLTVDPGKRPTAKEVNRIYQWFLFSYIDLLGEMGSECRQLEKYSPVKRVVSVGQYLKPCCDA